MKSAPEMWSFLFEMSRVPWAVLAAIVASCLEVHDKGWMSRPKIKTQSCVNSILFNMSLGMLQLEASTQYILSLPHFLISSLFSSFNWKHTNIWVGLDRGAAQRRVEFEVWLCYLMPGDQEMQEGEVSLLSIYVE